MKRIGTNIASTCMAFCMFGWISRGKRENLSKVGRITLQSMICTVKDKKWKDSFGEEYLYTGEVDL